MEEKTDDELKIKSLHSIGYTEENKLLSLADIVCYYLRNGKIEPSKTSSENTTTEKDKKIVRKLEETKLEEMQKKLRKLFLKRQIFSRKHLFRS